jgi:hypothetical protein
MTATITQLFPRIIQHHEIYADFKQAQSLLEEHRPSQLDQLAYRKSDPKELTAAKRIVLMGISARAKFAHLYTRTLAASYRAFEIHQQASVLLAEYPDPVAEQGITATKTWEGIKLTADLETVPALTREEINLAFIDATIRFLYDWCIQLAGNRPKNFQEMFNSRGATPSAATVKNVTQSYIAEMVESLNFSHPLPFYVIDRLLLNPQTGLPFDITIPSLLSQR